jgi:hypothetical protein
MPGVAMQILGTNTITCKTMGIFDVDDEDEQPAENPAVDVLLKPGAEPECIFRGITKVGIGLVRGWIESMQFIEWLDRQLLSC